MEQRPLIERLARHLAADAPDRWPARVEDAASILALMKEADVAMRDVGDPAMWEAMIDAALRMRWTIANIQDAPEPSPGADEEGEFRLTPDAVGANAADWVHLHSHQEKSP